MQFEFKNLVCERKGYQSRQQAVIYLLRGCPAKNYLFKLCVVKEKTSARVYFDSNTN